jgi:hypothetical protein
MPLPPPTTRVPERLGWQSPKSITVRLPTRRKETRGRVTPIADGSHPNLYYNQSKIDERLGPGVGASTIPEQSDNGT